MLEEEEYGGVVPTYVVREYRVKEAISGKDIETDNNVEILNPDHHICTLDKDGKFEAELEIRIGRGYCPADWNKKDEQEIGEADSYLEACRLADQLNQISEVQDG